VQIYGLVCSLVPIPTSAKSGGAYRRFRRLMVAG